MRCARSATSSLRLLALAPGLLGLFGCVDSQPVQQPFQFSHKRHFEAEVDCLTCHEKAADEPYATLPIMRGCMKCHKEPQGKTPQEQVLLQYAAKKEEVPWVQVNRLPGHVYFSHRAHVGFAEMECDACHGDMKKVEHALTEPNVGHLTMRACMDCHDQKSASNDCVTCHK